MAVGISVGLVQPVLWGAGGKGDGGGSGEGEGCWFTMEEFSLYWK